MPVINWIPPDPTDLILAGEEMRLNALGGSVLASQLGPLQAAKVERFAGSCSPLILEIAENMLVIADDQGYAPMHPDFTPYHSRLRSRFQRSMIANNAVICTPCGAIYPFDTGLSGQLINNFVQNTARFQITGVTRDSAGATLGNCRVVMLEVARISVNGTPVVAETISDGSGNYTIEVALNTAHQGIAYKDGSPDVAGISIDTLTPAQV
jgi:hypothetical protein